MFNGSSALLQGDQGLVQRLGEYQMHVTAPENFLILLSKLMDSVLVDTVHEQLLDIAPKKCNYQRFRAHSSGCGGVLED
jgi:hypothetical protein